eukprot:m.131259 g.131259  ORF g.131259 m.131259 type:complete len:205 (+) comp15742_c8_seq1:318-932(+)
MAKKGTHLLLHILYSFFLLLSGVFLTVAAAAPFWLLAPNDGYACGIFSECQDQTNLGCNIEVYGTTFSDIPSQGLRIAAGFLVAAIVITWLSFLISLVTCCFCYSITKIQIPALTVASLLMLGSLLAFGYAFKDFNTNEVNPSTGDGNGLNCDCGHGADKYTPYNCRLGHGAALSIAATIFLAITTAIAQAVKRRDLEEDLYLA